MKKLLVLFVFVFAFSFSSSAQIKNDQVSGNSEGSEMIVAYRDVKLSCGVKFKLWAQDYQYVKYVLKEKFVERYFEDWLCKQNMYCSPPGVSIGLSFEEIFEMKHGRTPTALEKAMLECPITDDVEPFRPIFIDITFPPIGR